MSIDLFFSSRHFDVGTDGRELGRSLNLNIGDVKLLLPGLLDVDLSE